MCTPIRRPGRCSRTSRIRTATGSCGSSSPTPPRCSRWTPPAAPVSQRASWASTASRARRGPTGGWSSPQTSYKAYQSLASIDGVDPLWCYAHIRRYFLRAGGAQPEALGNRCDAWTERCCTGAHHALAAATPGTSRRPSAARLRRHRRAPHPAGQRRRQGPAAPRRRHGQQRMGRLARHQDLPQLPLDNNTAERAPRTPVIGRRRPMGHSPGRRRVGITATGARHDIEPLGLLTGYLQECADQGGTAPARSRPGPVPAHGHAKDAPAVVRQ